MRRSDKIKVAISYSSNGIVHSTFPEELLQVCFYAGVDIKPIRTDSACIAVNRNNGVLAAQDSNCSHILFMDTDMRFPPDLIPRFLKHGRDIVGATYLRRNPPHTLLGRLMGNMENGLQEAIELPGGCIMAKIEMFERLKKPYFRWPTLESKDSLPKEIEGFDLNGYEFPGIMGEDFYFCQSARRAGFRVWTDLEVSGILSHIATKELKIGVSDANS